MVAPASIDRLWPIVRVRRPSLDDGNRCIAVVHTIKVSTRLGGSGNLAHLNVGRRGQQSFDE